MHTLSILILTMATLIGTPHHPLPAVPPTTKLAITSVAMTGTHSPNRTDYTLRVAGQGFVVGYRPEMSSQIEYMYRQGDPFRDLAKDLKWSPALSQTITVGDSSVILLQVP